LRLETLRRLPVLLAFAAAACGGSSTPPPPVAAASPTPATGGDLRPLSSREAAAPAGAPATSGAATAGPVDASAPLPPGHPPLDGAPSTAAALPPGHAPVGAPDPHGNVPGAAGKSAGTIAGTIALSPKLQVGPADVLYVMAKKGKATLAVRRFDKLSFPLAFEISGGDSMMAGADFDGPVDLVARVSKTGDAIPAKGDLEGTAKGVRIPAKGVQLTIDSVRQ
jgi:hypothetical protein